MSINTEGYVDIAGGKLYCVTFANNNGQNPIIVLHGGGGMLDHTYLLPQLLGLTQNHTVTFYDQRGTGKSAGFQLTPEVINIDAYMQDIEAIRNKLGYKKFVLLGHSWGGLLAMIYATLYPEHLTGLILADSIPATAAGFKRFAANIAINKPSTEFNHDDSTAIHDYYQKFYYRYFYYPALISQLTIAISPECYKNGIRVRHCFDTFLNTYDITADLKKLQVPTLIIHGDHDIVQPDTAMQTHNLINNSKIIIIKNCGHFSYIEEPQQFFAAIEQFLSHK